MDEPHFEHSSECLLHTDTSSDEQMIVPSSEQRVLSDLDPDHHPPHGFAGLLVPLFFEYHLVPLSHALWDVEY
jgi:hypothetical protein